MTMKEYGDLTLQQCDMLDMCVSELMRKACDYMDSQLELSEYANSEEVDNEKADKLLKSCDNHLFCMMDEMDTILRMAKEWGIYK